MDFDNTHRREQMTYEYLGLSLNSVSHYLRLDRVEEFTLTENFVKSCVISRGIENISERRDRNYQEVEITVTAIG